MSARRRKAAALANATPKPEPEVEEALKPTKVQLYKNPVVDWPELYINVFISEAGYEMPMGAMFGRARCYKARNIDEADLVVFCGGPDVNPHLYGEEAHTSYRGDDARDKRDLDLYLKCAEKGIPMVGICRGAQFGHVMNQGKLVQDADRHNGDHGMVVTPGNTISSSAYLQRVSSTHHQICIENDKMVPLAYVYQSEVRHLNNEKTQTGRGRDIEAFFYPETCFLGFQGHPEYAGYYPYTVWCLKMIEKYILHNPNIKMDEQRRYRMQKQVIIGLPGPVNEN